jgi:hypothetical protein
VNDTTDINQTKATALSLLARGLHPVPAHTIIDGSCTCGSVCETPGRHRKKVRLKSKKPTKTNVRANFSAPANILISTSQEGVAVLKVAKSKTAQANFKQLKKKSRLPLTMAINFLNNEYYIFSTSLQVTQTQTVVPGVKLLKNVVSLLMPSSVYTRKNGESEVVTFLRDIAIKRLPPNFVSGLQEEYGQEQIRPVQEKVGVAPTQKKRRKQTEHKRTPETVTTTHPQAAYFPKTAEEYPKAMRAAREGLGLTIQQLASSLKMGDYALQAIENGMVFPFDQYRRKLDPVLFGTDLKTMQKRKRLRQ